MAREPELHVPEIFPTEVVSAVRGLYVGGHVSAGRARRGLEQVRSVRLEHYPIEPFIPRIWELRDDLTVYDCLLPCSSGRDGPRRCEV